MTQKRPSTNCELITNYSTHLSMRWHTKTVRVPFHFICNKLQVKNHDNFFLIPSVWLYFLVLNF